MQMQVLVLDADVDRKFYNSVQMSLVDLSISPERKKKTYSCRFYDGLPGLAELRELVKQGAASDVITQQANVVAASLPQFQQQLNVEVYDVGGSGKYINLVCQIV